MVAIKLHYLYEKPVSSRNICLDTFPCRSISYFSSYTSSNARSKNYKWLKSNPVWRRAICSTIVHSNSYYKIFQSSSTRKCKPNFWSFDTTLLLQNLIMQTRLILEKLYEKKIENRKLAWKLFFHEKIGGAINVIYFVEWFLVLYHFAFPCNLFKSLCWKYIG